MKKRNRLLRRAALAGAAFGLAVTAGVLSTTGWLRSPGSVARAADAVPTADQRFQLRKGDHVAIVGDGLPDRMQHDGWLETLIYAHQPGDNLVFRNLSAAGDEVGTWWRSANFGTRDEWLARAKADVILAFYGYNESFKGDDGLPQFKKDLDTFLKETAAKTYNGKSAPRLVLFSPVAAERSPDPNLPDPTAMNANLQKYTTAMAEVARLNHVQFVDLFTPSQRVYEQAAAARKGLTVDGVHLTEEADKLMAPEIYRELFGESAPEGDHELLRRAVVQRNEMWHSRYRTVDGFNVYGGRSQLAYQPDKGAFLQNTPEPQPPFVSNYQVMQQEMSQRDVMTANRDQVIWRVARGAGAGGNGAGGAPDDLKPDDANLPKVTKVATNHPGPNPDKSWPFLSGEEAISKMTLAKGCKVNLFASEEQWPELIKPVQMAWDTKGRLWVSVWRNYPERTPDSKVGDSILIFEDTDGDGKADKCTHYMDDLNCPTGFQFYKDGILLMQAPNLWYVHTGPDGKAGQVERVLMGLDSADSHHTTNSMVLDPGGATYLSDGVFHRSQIETNAGVVRNQDGAVYRYEPRTGKFDTYVSYGFANPHGRVFDYWGNDIITDATGNASYYAPAFSGHIDFPGKHPAMNQFWQRPSRPCPGTGMVSSRHFPEEWQENFLNLNVIGFQGIYRVKLSEEGSGLKGTSLEDLVSSTDPNFRPCQANTGPDGAIYFADWSNDIIGHMQHHLRDPNRDHQHGRLYRITYEGRPLLKAPKIDGQPIAALLELLKEPEDGTRTLAKIELGKHDAAEVTAAAKRWAAALDKSDPAYAHHLTEALWVHQWMNVVDADLLGAVLALPVPEARAAATRVACYWRDRLPNVLDLLKNSASDESPRVRLEAVRAASFFRDPKAAEVALASLKYPPDYYLDYCLNETMRQLEPYWRKAVAEGKFGGDSGAGIAYLVKGLATADLLKLPQTPPVLLAIIGRPEVTDVDRNQALVNLAKLKGSSTAQALVEAVEGTGGNPVAAAAMAKMLPAQPTTDLPKVRESLVKLAASPTPEVRQPALAAIAAADGSFDKIYAEAKTATKLVDVLSAVPLVFDQDLRSTMGPRIKTFLTPQMPADVVAMTQAEAGISGRYVRISLPHAGTLSLAEVEVYSGGKNIAPNGKAKQSTTLKGGEPQKAIDGNTDGDFNKGSVSHTTEKDKKPSWELDLGADHPIDAIVVWNRTDGGGKYESRLDGYTLEVLDANHKETFKQENLSAPSPSARTQVGPDGLASIRRAAIKAAVSLQDDPKGTFAILVGLIQANDQTNAAARGIRAVPRKQWDATKAGDAVRAIIAWAKATPAGERTTPAYVETVQLAGDLAGILPPAEAAPLRAQLKDLRVAVIVVNTVREQLRYDTPRIVVEAGKQTEIIFQNDDFMPHNLVIVTGGSRPEIGQASLAMRPDETDAYGRAYVPNNKHVLNATKLVESGQRARITFSARAEEAEYEYVCTFPGHWEAMYGKLIVTKDVDAYLTAHPDAGPTPPAGAHVHEHGK